MFMSTITASFLFLISSQRSNAFAPMSNCSPLSSSLKLFGTDQYLLKHTKSSQLTTLHLQTGTSPRNEEPFQDASMRQVLGIKDAAHDLDKWKVHLQLMKPITWIPLSLIVMCGAASSGNYHWVYNPFDVNDRDMVLGTTDAMKALLTVILAGPMSEGFAQTINDWYDKDIDAINEPDRPIPSGAIKPQEVFSQLAFLLFGGLGIAAFLDSWANHETYTVTMIATVGYIISYIYSAPPLKLKQNGWLGALAIGVCYISFPWWCGLSVFSEDFTLTNVLIPLTWAITGISNAVMNDFKSVEGDKKFGLMSIPLMYGFDIASYIVIATKNIPPVLVSSYLYSIDEAAYATAILLLLIPHIYLQKTILLEDPLKNDVKYVASSSPIDFLGVLLSALCLGNHVW